METEDEASDAEAPGPGTSVADLSAQDRRTIDDDHANSQGNEMEQWTDLPLSGYIKCRFCAEEGPETCFMNEAQFKEHIELKHPERKAVWRCAACRRHFEKLHGWRVHASRCKGRETGNEAGDRQVKCQVCGETFRTQAGLGQHERYRHPQVRNLARQAKGNRGRNGPGNRASAWSKEEVELLIELDRRFHLERFPNVKIREFLPHKTLRQISDKRRLLPARGRVEANVEEESSSGSSVYISAEEEVNETPRRSIGREEWEEILQNAIMANSLQHEHPLRRTERLIQDIACWRRIQQVDIDLIVQNVTEMISGNVQGGPATRTRATGIRRNPHISSNGASGRIPNKRTTERRYEYARAQDTYKKCPQRLVDWAIAGKQPQNKQRLEPPAIEEIQPLYRDLWGTAGPQASLKAGRRPSDQNGSIMREV